ncbi:MAG: RNA polymerase sigma factor [Fimbriimonadaceae bacterium]
MSATDQSFDRLANRHKDAVLRQMVRACGNRDDAEDVLAETLVAAYRAMDRVREPDAFGGWLAKVAHRACSRLKASEAARPVVLGLGLDVASAPAMSDTKHAIQEALDGLPPRLREAFLLRDVQGLSSEEAAGRLGVTVGALKSRLHRAREQLRTELETAWDSS